MDARLIFLLFGILSSSYCSVSMNRKGDLYARSMLDGDIVFEPGMGAVVVDRGGYEYDILEQLEISNQVAAQVCWLVPKRPEPAWNNATAMPTAAYGSAAVTVGSSVFVIGGNNGISTISTVQALDVLKMTWSSKASMNFPRESHVAALHADGTRIYVFGGTGRTDIEIYDLQGNSWAVSTLTLPNVYNGVASAVVDNVVYFFGSQLNENQAHSFSMYNEVWKTNLQPMPTGRTYTAAASFGKEVFVYGGLNDTNGQPTNVFEVYNTITDSWATLQWVDMGRARHQLINFNGLLALVGGQTSFDYATASVYWYNTRNRMWRTDFAQLSLNRFAFSSAVAERQVFVFGGRPTVNNTTPTSLMEFTLPCF